MSAADLNNSAISDLKKLVKAKKTAESLQLKQAFLIDSDAELFMYLIQCIRFGS